MTSLTFLSILIIFVNLGIICYSYFDNKRVKKERDIYLAQMFKKIH